MRLALVDRDGTLNRKAPEGEYVTDPGALELLPGAAAAGARVDRFYVCPHERGACTCRKPHPGLLRRAARDFGVAPDEAVMIGDADSDVEAGRRFGARTVQLTAGASAADRTAPDLLTAVAWELEP